MPQVNFHVTDHVHHPVPDLPTRKPPSNCTCMPPLKLHVAEHVHHPVLDLPTSMHPLELHVTDHVQKDTMGVTNVRIVPDATCTITL